MSANEICPNCGNKYVEKVKFEHGMMVLSPSDEICLFVKEGGNHLMYFHINGGGDIVQTERKERTGTDNAKIDS